LTEPHDLESLAESGNGDTDDENGGERPVDFGELFSREIVSMGPDCISYRRRTA